MCTRSSSVQRLLRRLWGSCNGTESLRMRFCDLSPHLLERVGRLPLINWGKYSTRSSHVGWVQKRRRFNMIISRCMRWAWMRMMTTYTFQQHKLHSLTGNSNKFNSCSINLLSAAKRWETFCSLPFDLLLQPWRGGYNLLQPHFHHLRNTIPSFLICTSPYSDYISFLIFHWNLDLLTCGTKPALWRLPNWEAPDLLEEVD